MTTAIQHRGPDGEGYYSDAHAWLGHRRLSIVDVAGGAQPMTNETGNLWIVYNGEIYNHADLRPALERAGHQYRTRCDTEAIVHAYEQYGPDCLERFRGMFAFALWDKSSRTLFCARDRLGIKPFYYYWDGKLFAFASEIKALLEHPAISPVFDESLLSEYLAFGYTSGERTLFSGIRKLMPGHYLTLSESGLAIRRYWDVPEAEERDSRHEESWVRECRERLETSVQLRLMSDVPLGMFLSGGVDSSAIAALMMRMVREPVKTFAVGYRETAFSELAYARQAAAAIGTDHREVTIGMEDFFNALPQLIWHEDEPITWPSSVSLYFVSRLAAQEVKVVLTGEGSDELFGGYARYHSFGVNNQWLQMYRFLPRMVRSSVRNGIAGSTLLSRSLRRKLQHTMLGRGEELESLYLDNFYSAFGGEEQRRMLAKAPAHTYESFLRYWDSRPNANWLDRLLYTDVKTYLVELLMKQDQMSMACSIESRVPFLDHTLVEFAAQVPRRLKIRGRTGKYILKRSVEDLLPRELVYRP
ncbi:MAG: asparagine synthase (glutamine-hydrolyzing), partial [Bryobacterales bacterium]|nr:asparagine synthase (glutamine-hydrolyzing) [Bryobacterales bacterium]